MNIQCKTKIPNILQNQKILWWMNCAEYGIIGYDQKHKKSNNYA